MLFFTIALLALSLFSLIKGRVFRNLQMEALEENIKKAQQGTDNYKFENYGLAARMILFMGFAITYFITLLIYLTNAIQIDPLLFPSVAALSYYILSFVIGFVFRDKNDYSTDEKIERARNKAKRKRTFKGTLISLLWITYYVYIGYTLIIL